MKNKNDHEIPKFGTSDLDKAILGTEKRKIIFEKFPDSLKEVYHIQTNELIAFNINSGNQYYNEFLITLKEKAVQTEPTARTAIA